MGEKEKTIETESSGKGKDEAGGESRRRDERGIEGN